MMKPERKQKKVSAKTVPLSAMTRQESPEWVKQMHSYFRLYGSYRAEDVQRVLGDSRNTVQGENVDHVQHARCLVTK